MTTFVDDAIPGNGTCSLREAIAAANTRSIVDGCDPSGMPSEYLVPILLGAGTYAVTGGLVVSGTLTISGVGAGVTVIRRQGGPLVSLFENSGTLFLDGLTVTGGISGVDGTGTGGGIHNTGTLGLEGVRVTGNRADSGGGIFNMGSVTIRRSSIDSNRGDVEGGGVASISVGPLLTVDVFESTIAKNITGGSGGGVENSGNSVVTLTNTTISDNDANSGGGIYNVGVGVVNLENVTVSFNTSASDAGGIDNFGTIALHNALVARNSGYLNPDCRNFAGDPIVSLGYNLIQDVSTDCNITGNLTGNVTGVDPVLGPLRSNGGPTLTRAIGAGSPAIDTGDPATTLDIDQRGAERPVNVRADIGAYESGGLINDSWLTALRIDATTVPTINQTLDFTGQSRWYKFSVSPNSELVAQLTNLAANYDLTLYKDIASAFDEVTSTRDLLHLSAEFADDAFNPDTFSPDTFSPDTFSPDTFSPDTFSPDTFSPDTFSPDTFSPDTFSPDTFSPDTFSPDTFSPDTFSPDTFSSAQTRSLLGVSAYDGLAGEGIRANTWLNDGDYYLRVRGRNGAFNATSAFQLQVALIPGACAGADPPLVPGNASATALAGEYRTLIITDSSRMTAAAPGDVAALVTRLQTFAARPEIAGQVIDFAGDAGIGALNAQADRATDCPFAKNLVAGAIKALIDDYWDLNPGLQYIVIAGDDSVVPFYRHPDQSLIGNERNFIPPVHDRSASQASLRLGYYLSQDRYGASTEISLRSGTLPLPDLALGRLVETPREIAGQLDLYIANDGAALHPQTSLVTGYDFLDDAAADVEDELLQGTGQLPDALVTARGISPLDPRSWTADDLREALLTERHDLIFLAGHFSAASALAADFSTRVLASELATSTVDFENALIFSVGCHAGYNLVDADAVAGVTESPDWPQAAAQQRAILIAGTGYQYGDTDFVEYSERLYRAFSRQLRAGTGPLAIGEVLVAAKHQYLTEVPAITGLHEKALLEATLFGLPMVLVDMPAGRGAAPTEPSIVSDPQPYDNGPGAELGLQRADISITTPTTQHSVVLQDPQGGSTTAMYLSGPDGVVTNPAQPVLPLSTSNVSVAEQVVRGVGFRGGVYTDQENILPLTGAPTMEVRGVHVPFYSPIFFPVQPYGANYFGELIGVDGATQLMLTPAQYRSASPGALTGVLRSFSNMDFRLYYSNDTSAAALTSAPMVLNISDFVADGKLTVTVKTQGGSTAGVQEVWITYTGVSAPFFGSWQSLDLIRDALDPDLWTGTLDLQGSASGDFRYVVQAASGVGLVTMLTNLGAYYVPGGVVTAPISEDRIGTSLTIQSPAAGASAPFGADVNVTALLQDAFGTPLANKTVTLGLGNQSRRVTTGSDGTASAELRLLGLPGEYTVQATFDETVAYTASQDARPLTVTKRDTQIDLEIAPSADAASSGTVTVNATLGDDAGNPLGLKTLYITLSGGATGTTAVITDFAGRATVTYTALGGVFTVSATFAGGLDGQPADPRYNASTATLEAGGPGGIDSVGPIVVPANPVAVRSVMQVNAPFSVSGSGAVTAEWDWGDGTTSAGAVDAPGEAGTVSGSHVYTRPGVYTVTLTITLGEQSASTSATVVAFDSSGATVRGNGWFSSPPGALTADPRRSGRVTFAVSAQYRRGGTIPTGTTVVQFNAGNLTFKSTRYEWLIVSGNRATLKGSGKINGSGNYGFVLTVSDGRFFGKDFIRFKIIDPATNAVIYDTQHNAADTAAPTTVVGGGQIFIVRSRYY